MKLKTKNGKDIEYVVESHITRNGKANKIVLNQMEASAIQDIRVVDEFPDVFPNELPGYAT